MLNLNGLTKEYPGGLVALRWDAHDSLEVRAGEIHGIVGENGAGKSTLFGVVAGTLPLSGGSLELDGQPYAPTSVGAARRSGVEIVTQEPALVGGLTVTENFFLGRGSADPTRGGLQNHRGTEVVRQALADIAPQVSPRSLAGSLSLKDQKLVELARAVFFARRLLLVDEMSAVLDQAGLETLFGVLRARRAAGMAILYISHYLEEVGELCDRISVMRDGQLVTTIPVQEATPERLSTLMVGRAIAANLYPGPPPAELDHPVFTGTNLSVDGEFCDVSFQVGRGEIVGVGGLMGCGSDALARVMFGAMHLSSGQMTLEGHSYAPRGPRAAIDQRVAYVPPDRDREGLFLRLPIGANATMAALPRLTHGGMRPGRGESRRVSDLIDQLAIRCRGVSDIPLNLSGGNRQKVVLAKWLATRPRLLILHNPTRGVDVGAKAEIYTLIRRLADDGVAIVLVSDELPELLGLSTRIVILRRGRIADVVASEDKPDERALIAHMI